MKNKGLAWIYVAAYAVVIFFISSIPGSSPVLQTVEKFIWDKLLHLLEYSILGILLVRALVLGAKVHPLKSWVFTAFVFGSLYAVVDEWHQSFVPMRDMNIYDWMADSMGVFIGASIYGFLLFRKSKVPLNA
ncbi:MAG: hypothetical protein AUJ72_02330 [Candidatus Omnitrophica bacterium CG1_02_46_14]|nr:MAG: hypothetical protein AUJ72_02330 [Candidatus Omnitrophica bacterium CG1_02_46_14]